MPRYKNKKTLRLQEVCTSNDYSTYVSVRQILGQDNHITSHQTSLRNSTSSGNLAAELSFHAIFMPKIGTHSLNARLIHMVSVLTRDPLWQYVSLLR